jgi:hypothetical protein
MEKQQQYLTGDIFGTNDRIRDDIDLESIPPERRAAFVTLAEAQARCRQTEANEHDANERVEDRVRKFAAAEARVPKQTHVELVKATFNLV